jgi:hypothetical protein
MKADKQIETFLSQYKEPVFGYALQLRKILFANLPDIIEQIDIPAKMIAYCYGQKYSELICTIIPSKKGLKLGFNWGLELTDPGKLLQGKGKISRYVEIISEEQINSREINNLIENVLSVYKQKKSFSKNSRE